MSNDWRQAGCLGRADHELAQRPSPYDDPWAAGLLEEIDAIGQAVAADPRVTQAVAAWSACVADAGHPGLTDHAEAGGQVMEQYLTLRAQVAEESVDLAQDAAEGSPEALTEFERRVAERAADLAPEEIALAVADHDCTVSSRVDAVTSEVSTELEEEFLAAHRGDLDALVRAYGRER